MNVRVRLDEGAASLAVTDDGRGFGQAEPGFGLRGMDERLRPLGGSLSVDAGPDGGTRLLVTIPVARP